MDKLTPLERELLEVLEDALKLAKLASELTANRSDDAMVWSIQEDIEAAIAKAKEQANG